MLFAFCLWFLRLFLESFGIGDDFLGHKVVEGGSGTRLAFLLSFRFLLSLIIRWQGGVLNGVFHIRGKN